MDYDAARAQFLAAAESSQSAPQRLRAAMASNRFLRRGFDDTYGRMYRALYSSRRVRRRVAPYLDRSRDISFSPTGTGFSQDAEVAMLAKLGAVRGQEVLLIGVEYAGEVAQLWGPHRPKQIIGIDIGDYEAGWVEHNRTKASSKLPLSFIKMDAAHIGLKDGTVDLVYSQGVVPHIVDVPSFLADAERVLRPGGIFYAFCCPLWHTFGGSHVHALGYDHLRLPESELLQRAKALQDGSYWWLEQALFNKLRFRELLEMIEARFEILRVGVIEAPDGRLVRDEKPAEWRDLLRDHDEEDLLIRLVSFTGRRRTTTT
jgi:SAM-dependent methyltransferase